MVCPNVLAKVSQASSFSEETSVGSNKTAKTSVTFFFLARSTDHRKISSFRTETNPEQQSPEIEGL